MSPLIPGANPDPTTSSPFRQYIPPKDRPKTRGLDRADPYVYSRGIVERPGPKEFIENWTAPLKKPFYGITNDGVRRENLYTLCDEGAPVKEMVAAAQLILDGLTDEERDKVMYDIDSEEWRKWCNPEFIIHDIGIRLEHLQQPQIDSIINLLRQSLSESGSEKAEAARKTNHFLGEICNSQAVLNENSYSFMLFGTPSEEEPWGYTFFGHHLCLNVFIIGQQMTIGPVFIGAEPNIIDAGPNKGITLCTQEAKLGLRLIKSLSPSLRRSAQLYTKMYDPTMPPSRWNPHDERHQAGAFKDNIILPPTGICATSMSAPQQSLLLEILETYSSLLPSGPLASRMQLTTSYLPETYFSWIGGYGSTSPSNDDDKDDGRDRDEDEVFYYCIHSPVILVEFDCHCGKFLINEQPGRFHVHSILRLPNGGDYGRALIEMFKKAREGKLR